MAEATALGDGAPQCDGRTGGLGGPGEQVGVVAGAVAHQVAEPQVVGRGGRVRQGVEPLLLADSMEFWA